MSKKKGLGTKIMNVYPNASRMKMIVIIAIAFVLIIIIASIYYAINDISYTYANVFLIDLALLAGGSFLGRVTILYENGIEYQNIKSYEFRDLKKSKSVLTIMLRDDLKFATVLGRKDQEPLNKILKKFV